MHYETSRSFRTDLRGIRKKKMKLENGEMLKYKYAISQFFQQSS